MIGIIDTNDLELSIQDNITKKWYPLANNSKYNLSIAENVNKKHYNKAHFIINNCNEAILLQLM